MKDYYSALSFPRQQKIILCWVPSWVLFAHRVDTRQVTLPVVKGNPRARGSIMLGQQHKVPCRRNSGADIFMAFKPLRAHDLSVNFKGGKGKQQ